MLKLTINVVVLVVVVIACNALQVVSFQLKNNNFNSKSKSSLLSLLRQRPADLLTTTLWAISKEEESALKTEEKEETTLTLQGEITISSNPVLKVSDDELSEFFRTPSNRNLLITGGGERPCSEIEATLDILDDWKRQCLSLSACEPNENDSILSVVSPGIKFPGLKVESVAMVGVKFIDERQAPRYEFVLLANDQKASGLAPAVWIFNKLTGKNDDDDNDNDGKENNSKIKSLSTVTYQELVEEEDNGGNTNIVFQTTSFLSIGIKFPKFLLKILPGDKKTIEERGGKSIIKTLDKDVVQSMKAFESAYLNKF